MSDEPDRESAPEVYGPGARLWILRQLFERAHAQLDATIDMLDDALDGESDPAPSVPPQ